MGRAPCSAQRPVQQLESRRQPTRCADTPAPCHVVHVHAAAHGGPCQACATAMDREHACRAMVPCHVPYMHWLVVTSMGHAMYMHWMAVPCTRFVRAPGDACARYSPDAGSGRACYSPEQVVACEETQAGQVSKGLEWSHRCPKPPALDMQTPAPNSCVSRAALSSPFPRRCVGKPGR